MARNLDPRIEVCGLPLGFSPSRIASNAASRSTVTLVLKSLIF
jgi:hypothetical protein